MAGDFDMGGAQFPITRHSAILAIRSDDAEVRARSCDILSLAYWKPVYKYVRLKWRKSSDDAQDLTQAFFAKAFEKGYFDAYDPTKARFRTFMRTCLDRFVANDDKAGKRLKRGGDTRILSLDFEQADGELARSEPPSPDNLDQFFDQEWVRSLFSMAVEALREECTQRGKVKQFRVFELYDLEEGTAPKRSYASLAQELGVSVTDVTNYLSFARREFRRTVLEKLREITASEEEYRMEARAVLGVGD
jgi:RNA polymerase sigma factor (sigma-70 family)